MARGVRFMSGALVPGMEGDGMEEAQRVLTADKRIPGWVRPDEDPAPARDPGDHGSGVVCRGAAFCRILFALSAVLTLLPCVVAVPAGAMKPYFPSYVSEQYEINEFLRLWKGAWEGSAGPQGDMEKYISLYSEDFSARGMNRAQWKVDKTAKNRRKEWIRIELSEIRISDADSNGILRVSFMQDYKSSNFSVVVQKTLVLRKEAGQWKILSIEP
jgi:hypothetical protein